jgi:hypothetical protein
MRFAVANSSNLSAVKKKAQKLAVIALLGLLATPLNIARGDTVLLKNGGRVMGLLMEVDPDGHVSLRLADGTVRKIPWADVKEIIEDEPAVEEAGVKTSPPSTAAIPTARRPAAKTEPQQNLEVELGGHAPVEAVAPGRSEGDGRYASTVDPEEPSARGYPPRRGSLMVGGFAGLAGHIELDAETVSESAHGELDLDSSYGFALAIDVPVHAFLAVGASAGLGWLSIEGSTESTAYFDVAGNVGVRYPFWLGAQEFASLFLHGSLGVGYVDVDPEPMGAARFRWDASVAFVLGMTAGLRVMLANNLGFAISFGWMQHSFNFAVDGVINGEAGSADIDYQLRQWTLRGGLLLGF